MPSKPRKDPLSRSSQKRKKILYAVSILVFLLVFFLVFFTVGKPMLRFVSDPQKFQAWVEQHGFWGQLCFIGMVVLQVIVAVIPGEPLEIAAGYAFGAWRGTLLSLIGIVLGSMVVFGFVRKFGVKAVELFFPKSKIQSLSFLHNTKQLNLITFLLFLIPGTPKDILTYFIGLTPMQPGTWLFITLIARLPSVITSTIGGHALGDQNYLSAVLIFAGTLFLSLLGVLIYRWLADRDQKGGSSES